MAFFCYIVYTYYGRSVNYEKTKEKSNKTK